MKDVLALVALSVGMVVWVVLVRTIGVWIGSQFVQPLTFVQALLISLCAEVVFILHDIPMAAVRRVLTGKWFTS